MTNFDVIDKKTSFESIDFQKENGIYIPTPKPIQPNILLKEDENKYTLTPTGILLFK